MFANELHGGIGAADTAFAAYDSVVTERKPHQIDLTYNGASAYGMW